MSLMGRSASNARDFVASQTIRKKALGAYYTPVTVSRLLCNWAIRASTDTALEPCFGGCTFVEASVERLKSLGVLDPGKNLFGCDIDPNAFRYLHDRVPEVRDENSFFQTDFLRLRPNEIPTKVDAVVGNPPYVSLTALDPDARLGVREWERTYGYQVGRRASLWAHFVLHSLSFVKQGGRIAWVLPAALLTSKYSSSTRAEICARFERVAFVTLAERLFIEEGTDERTVILMAEGLRPSRDDGSIAYFCLDEVEQLAQLIDGWHELDWANADRSVRSTRLVPESALDLLSDIGSGYSAGTLGDFADVEIGVVAGDSKFLIKSLEEWRNFGISESSLQYIAPASRWIDGLIVRKGDEKKHTRNGVRCFGLNAARSPRQKALVNYLSSYGEESIRKNVTFSKRAVWHQFLDTKLPDGFFVFMTHLGPRLVLNGVGANATNSLYRIYFKSKRKKYKKLIAISLQTTACQVAAELAGQFRGAGALKLEPSHVRNLPIFFPQGPLRNCDIVFRQIDELLRRGENDQARRAADEFIFGNSLDMARKIGALADDLIIARRRRIRKRNGVDTHGQAS